MARTAPKTTTATALGGSLRKIAATRSKKAPPAPRAGDGNGTAGRSTPRKAYDPGVPVEAGEAAVSYAHERDNGQVVPCPHWRAGHALRPTTHPPDRAHLVRDLKRPEYLQPGTRVPNAPARTYPAAQFDPRGRTPCQIEDQIHERVARLARELGRVSGIHQTGTVADRIDQSLNLLAGTRRSNRVGLRDMVETRTRDWDPVNRVWVYENESVCEAIARTARERARKKI